MNTYYLNSLKTFVIMLSIVLTASSCGKDEDNPEQSSGTIDVAVGTYKGTIKLYPGTDHYDAEIIVTKVDNERLKVAPKSGQPYSNANEKTIRVQYQEYEGDVQEVLGDLSGTFWYKADGKTLRVSTKQQAEDEVVFVFEGAKQ